MVRPTSCRYKVNTIYKVNSMILKIPFVGPHLNFDPIFFKELKKKEIFNFVLSPK